MSFIEKLDDESLAFFNDLATKPFSQQAVAFLNAYWEEVGSQAEFIFNVSWELIKYADMHTKGVNYIHLYDEGFDLDFNIGLYFYEKLCKFVEDNPKWAAEEWAPSQPQMMTAIVRKKELREKVDVNFDGRVSLLEVLLFQYQDFANPKDFISRSISSSGEEEHPEMKKARLALEAVTQAMREYETEKTKLEEGAALPGVKGLMNKNLLAQLGASPLKEQLTTALIKAEAAVRKAVRLFGKGAPVASGAEGKTAPQKTSGSVWWMQRDLAEKKKRYGR